MRRFFSPVHFLEGVFAQTCSDRHPLVGKGSPGIVKERRVSAPSRVCMKAPPSLAGLKRFGYHRFEHSLEASLPFISPQRHRTTVSHMASLHLYWTLHAGDSSTHDVPCSDFR